MGGEGTVRPEEALAEAVRLQVEHGNTEIVENDGEPDGPAFAIVPPVTFARRILAALPHGWRLTDDQPSADAYRRGYADGSDAVRRQFLGDGE